MPPRSPGARLTAAALALGALPLAACRPAPRPPAASVVFILVDTLRADHLGAYGYSRPTSPTIDRLASESLVYRQARSVAPWTNPTIASLFTGRRPNAIFEAKPHRQAIQSALPAELPTLAETLHAAGVRTAAVVDHPGISPGLGFARGFESFDRSFLEGDKGFWAFTDEKVVLRQVAAALDGFGRDRFFLYLHLVYPHRPYDPRPPYDGMFGEITRETSKPFREQMINAYDAEIRFTDEVIADVLGELARRDRLDDPWIVVTSDHGEGFWEHGRDEHGNSLFDELLHVPLIVRPPVGSGIAPRSVVAPVSLADLHATVLEAAAGDRISTPRLSERSLLRHLDRRRTGGNADVVSQQQHSGDVNAAALVRDHWKLIRRYEDRRDQVRLFDLAADPGEHSEVTEAHTETARRLERALLQHLASDARDLAAIATGSESPLDTDEIARLRALGYLQ